MSPLLILKSREIRRSVLLCCNFDIVKLDGDELKYYLFIIESNLRVICIKNIQFYIMNDNSKNTRRIVSKLLFFVAGTI